MRALLIVIDLQKGWRHPTATEPAMLRTVELCKRFPGDVLHCCFRNDPASLFHTQLNWTRFTEAGDTDQIPEIAELDLPIQWRSTYSCLNEQTLPIVQKYDRVYIAGVFTDISVASTAMDIFDRNIPVYVVRDCVATLHGEDVHAGALKSLGFAIGEGFVVPSAEVLKELAS